MLYFDHNATTPVCEEAIEAWVKATRDLAGNPSSQHRLGSRSERAIDEAREELAASLGCRSHEIIWTSGATESANMVFHHVAETSPNNAPIWVSSIEHPCVIESARQRFGDRVCWIPVTSDGVVDRRWIEDRLRTEQPALLAVMAANNETGVLQPWREVQEFCKSAKVPFFCDAAQWIGKLPAAELGACDFTSGCAHKFGGPKGIGFLKVPDKSPFRPMIHGGPQEEKRRAGTENVAGIISMMTALRLREKALGESSDESLSQSRKDFENQLLAALPDCRIIGHDTSRLWNTSMAIMPSADCRARWVVKLDKLGVAVSTGSACASGKEASSHVLSAMGLSDEQAGLALRFSAGWETKPADWCQLLEKIREAAATLAPTIADAQ